MILYLSLYNLNSKGFEIFPRSNSKHNLLYNLIQILANFSILTIVRSKECNQTMRRIQSPLQVDPSWRW